jgi:SWI/SNF-related matrix-associated actin-dependent regulator of chromatin subfamily A member 5
LLPQMFSSSDDFDEWFNLSPGDETVSEEEKEKRNKKIIEQLHRIMRPFLLRRIKKDVEYSLKPKVEIHVNVGITEQ